MSSTEPDEAAAAAGSGSGDSRDDAAGVLAELLDDGGTAPAPRAGRLRSLLRLLAWTPLLALAMAGLVAPFVLPPAFAVREAAYLWEDLPTALPLDAPLPRRTVLTDVDGRPFAVLQGQDRSPVRLDEVAPVVIEALLAAEDDRFFDKGAVDAVALARALLSSTGGDLQGGSGITQQYVKNLLLTEARTEEQQREATEQTVSRKLRELKYAAAVERALTKEQILERYLNTVNFGDGAYGIASAARHYFSVEPSQLTLAQAALLVGILKSPTYYNPVDNPDRSRVRRDAVLQRLAVTGRASQTAVAAATREPVALDITETAQGCGVSRYPFFCRLVVEALADDAAFGATPEARQERLFRGGLVVRTTLDRAAMSAAQISADAALRPKNRVATGIAVVEPGTGHVAAIATNRRWGRDESAGQTELLLPALPAYQPGSTFKAVTLAAVVDAGIPLTTRLDTPDGYIPQGMNHPPGGFHNDDDRGHGVIDAYAATAGSVNTWFIRIQERVGVLKVAAMAERLGITSLPRSGPRAITERDASLTLGAYEVSPLDMATAYATLAAGGVRCKPVVVISLLDADGERRPGQDPQCTQAVSPFVAASVTQALERALGPGGTGQGLGPGRPAAGKTGTTNDSAATWFAGYTPQYAVAVWVGDPRGGQRYPLRDITAYGSRFSAVYGRTVAGPIWQSTMRGLHRGLAVQPFERPEDGAVLGSRVVVPDLYGLSADAAASLLVGAGFRVQVRDVAALPDQLLVPGQVAAQQPAAGTLVRTGSRVVITLSDGSTTDVVVPGR